MKLGNQIIDTLIEFIQGPCRENQRALISAKIIDNCRNFLLDFQITNNEADLISRGFDLEDDDHLESINETKQGIVTLLLSLLEGTPDSDIINRMSQSLDFTLMKERMAEVYTEFIISLMKIKNPKEDLVLSMSITYVDKYLKQDSFDENLQEGFDIYILLNDLADNSVMARENLDESQFTLEQKRAYDFFENH
jgi:hypothetical protein